MKVAIDLTPMMAIPTGVDVYLFELVRHLAIIDRVNRYKLFVNFGDRARFESMIGANMTLCPCSFRGRPMRFLFQQFLATPLAAAGPHDVFHSPSFLMPMWRGRGKHLLTVHDLTFFSMPRVHSPLHRSAPFLHGVRASIRRADLVNVPSEATQCDLLRSLPDVDPGKIRVTPWGIHSRFCPANAEETARRIREIGLPVPYILAVGAIEPRKNLVTLLESFEKLVSSGATSLNMVIAGPKRWGASEVYRKAALPTLRQRVYFTGHVPDDDLPWIYRGACMFAYMSLSEGFGFPPLEAMACGVPVIAADNSSLRENLLGAADLVPATDHHALFEAFRRLLTHPQRRDELVRLGRERVLRFRWEYTARRVLDCYRQLAEEPGPVI